MNKINKARNASNKRYGALHKLPKKVLNKSRIIKKTTKLKTKYRRRYVVPKGMSRKEANNLFDKFYKRKTYKRNRKKPNKK